MSVSTYLRELLVEVILHKAPEVDICLILRREGRDLLLAVLCKTLPLREVRRAVGITKYTERSIRKKP